MRKLSISLLVGLIFAIGVSAIGAETQKNVAASVIRLHIVANSDSDRDQEVKLMVRDELIKQIAPMTCNSKNIDDAIEIVTDNLSLAENICKNVLKKNGFLYGAKAYYGKAEFPVKKYANVTFPAGEYNALRVVLGEGKGHNWWCVMYPPLCFAESAEGEFSTESLESLKNNIDAASYAMLADGKVPINFKFKIWEIIEKWGLK